MSNLFASFLSGGRSNPDPSAYGGDAGIPEPAVTLQTNLQKIDGDFGDREHFYVHSSISCGGDTTSRVPCNVVLVIDVSGSMGDSVTTGNNEVTGLNILHIVKHAVNTIKEVSNEFDRIGIVKFNDRAEVVMPMQNMTAAGKDVVTSTLARLSPGGSTNIYGAMEKAFETLRNDASTTVRNSFVLLLTDGVPNVDPPQGMNHVDALNDWKSRNCGGHLPGTLSTFGFGYNLESALLRDLSNSAGGMYSFIPDAGMVGTAFINAISNVMCSSIRDVNVNFETASADVQIVPDVELNESSNHVSLANGCIVRRSSVQAGQSFDVIKRISVPKQTSMDSDICLVNVDYKFIGQASSGDSKVVTGETMSKSKMMGMNWDLMANKWRLRLVSLLKETHTTLVHYHQQGMGSGPNPAMDKINRFSQDLSEFIDDNRMSMPSNITDRLRDLQEDVDGQVKEACGRNDFWIKWGRHYLPSLTRAHDLQQSNNFKDPGIQHYGGALFKQVQDFADDCFSKLPPPQGNPTRSTYTSSSSSYSASAPAAPVNMAAFNNRDAGCVHGDSAVQLINGDVKKASSIIRGDVLSNGCVVEGVLKTLCHDNEASLCQIDDLLITPYHPVMHKGKWTFPADLAKVHLVPCDALFSFLLLKSDGKFAQSLPCSQVECIALGHGIENDAVASHPFFGSKIVESMKCAKDYSRADGVVTLCQSNSAGTMVRDPVTNLISGLVPLDTTC